MHCRPYFFAWALIALISCASKSARMEMRAVDGGAGLTLAIPEGYAAEPSIEGLRVYLPTRERSRSPVHIYVSTVMKAPSWQDAMERDVDDREIHYLVTDDEAGGSAGPARKLEAWVASGGRFIVLESLVQPDSGGDPEFRAEWAILPSLRWQSPAK